MGDRASAASAGMQLWNSPEKTGPSWEDVGSTKAGPSWEDVGFTKAGASGLLCWPSALKATAAMLEGSLALLFMLPRR